MQANILEYTEEGKIALSQWADWEVEQAAAGLEDEEETDLTIDVSVWCVPVAAGAFGAKEDSGALGT